MRDQKREQIADVSTRAVKNCGPVDPKQSSKKQRILTLLRSILIPSIPFVFFFLFAMYFAFRSPPETPTRSLPFPTAWKPYSPSIRPHLFSPHLPEQERLIATISYELLEQETTVKKQGKELSQRKKELHTSLEKIHRMEQTIDALAKASIDQAKWNQVQTEKIDSFLQQAQEKEAQLHQLNAQYTDLLESFVYQLDSLALYPRLTPNSQLHLAFLEQFEIDRLINQSQDTRVKTAQNRLSVYQDAHQSLNHLTCHLEESEALNAVLYAQGMLDQKREETLQISLRELKVREQNLTQHLQTSLTELRQTQEALLTAQKGSRQLPVLKKTLSEMESALQRTEEAKQQLAHSLRQKIAKIESQKNLIQALENAPTPSQLEQLVSEQSKSLAELQNDLQRKQQRLIETRDYFHAEIQKREMTLEKSDLLSLHERQEIQGGSTSRAKLEEKLVRENRRLQQELTIADYRFQALQKALEKKTQQEP